MKRQLFNISSKRKFNGKENITITSSSLPTIIIITPNNNNNPHKDYSINITRQFSYFKTTLSPQPKHHQNHIKNLTTLHANSPIPIRTVRTHPYLISVSSEDHEESRIEQDERQHDPPLEKSRNSLLLSSPNCRASLLFSLTLLFNSSFLLKFLCVKGCVLFISLLLLLTVTAPSYIYAIKYSSFSCFSTHL